MNKKTIIYTLTDEAPLLASYSLVPFLQSLFKLFGYELKLMDISLAARLLSSFGDFLPAKLQKSDDLKYLATLVKNPDCMIIKLPNISASLSQLKDCITELQDMGYAVPNYPMLSKDSAATANNAVLEDVFNRYNKILGSAVNPKLRDGNSDRRIPRVVKVASLANPHKNRSWSKEAKSEVISMSEGDFYHSEKSYLSDKDQTVDIVFSDNSGNQTKLVSNIDLCQNDVIDGAFLDKLKLQSFIKSSKEYAKKQGILFSLHLKATMMKVSDPKIFGYSLEAYFEEFFQKHSDNLASLKFDYADGLANLIKQLESSQNPSHKTLIADLKDYINNDVKLAMVDSDNCISNFHVSSDIIIDASMAAMIRDGGMMYDSSGRLDYALAVIPDRCYAGVYKQVLDFCKKNGSFDPTTMGSFANVGLMADKAQEYGSHPYTFIAKSNGEFAVVSSAQKKLFSHAVKKDDIWRMCKTSNKAILSWCKLFISRTKNDKLSKKTYVWLDDNRAHDRMIKKVLFDHYNKDFFSEAGITFADPHKACSETLKLLKNKQNVIGATGNVLRDYLTDLFPILEIGTSAKMLSVIALNNGGGLFETGSGGTAPKHLKQLLDENHLRWNSLGEYLALSECLDFICAKNSSSSSSSDGDLSSNLAVNDDIEVLASSFKKAIELHLSSDKSPKRNKNQLDTRGSHFYFILYVLKFLHESKQCFKHQSFCSKLYTELANKKASILHELTAVKGNKISLQELGGYYYPQEAKASQVMRPSKVLFDIWHNAFNKL